MGDKHRHQVFPFVSKHGLKTEKTLMAQNYKMLLIFVRGWQKLAFPSGGLESSSCQWHCLQEITALAFTLGRSRCRRCSQIVLRPTPVSEVPVFPDSHTTPVILKSQGSSAFTPCFSHVSSSFAPHQAGGNGKVQSRCQFCLDSRRLCLLGSEPRELANMNQTHGEVSYWFVGLLTPWCICDVGISSFDDGKKVM